MNLFQLYFTMLGTWFYHFTRPIKVDFKRKCDAVMITKSCPSLHKETILKNKFIVNL